MYISCLATDYDGTLAHDGIVDEATADALGAFRRSGRKLLLVTGRELPDLIRVFPRIDLFDRVVAENGALLFEPATKKETPLGPEPSPELVETLRKKGVRPLSVGRSIVATCLKAATLRVTGDGVRDVPAGSWRCSRSPGRHRDRRSVQARGRLSGRPFFAETPTLRKQRPSVIHAIP
jgi:hypothetical protein